MLLDAQPVAAGVRGIRHSSPTKKPSGHPRGNQHERWQDSGLPPRIVREPQFLRFQTRLTARCTVVEYQLLQTPAAP